MPNRPRDTANLGGMAEIFFAALGDPKGSSGDAIRRQEADGQGSFATSDTLPTQMSEYDRTVLERAGVVFEGQVPGDEMFTYVTLPAGWTKVPTDHSLWSDLVDEKGRKRAAIFYKAAFYDRSAHLRTICRFGLVKDYDYEATNNAIKYTVTDGNAVVFSTQPHPFTGEKFQDDWRKVDTTAEKEARSWLTENFPNWEDPGAYWD